MGRMDGFDFGRHTVLFVDDDPLTREVMEILLQGRFGRVLVAEDGKEALELFLLHKPDAIITDIEMPVMNGLLLLKKIKETHPEVPPVIIMTAFADEAHKADKADAVILKPVYRKTLFETLERLLATAN